MNITSITARQILDSRGNPTVEADVMLENGTIGRAAVPSGASTGTHEALELRDGETFYGGKGVLKAVAHVKHDIAPALIGKDITDQKALDQAMIDLDGTPTKSRLGANALLAVSLAAAKAAAQAQNQPFFAYLATLAQNTTFTLPVPMMNIINGGKHAAGSTDIQEFMILPIGAPTFADALRMGTEVFHALGKVLKENGYGTTVGDEGGYAPQVRNGNAEALDLIAKAIAKAGYTLGSDIVLGLDVAASELFINGNYTLMTENKTMTSDDMIAWYESLLNQYPIVSIEDGLDQEDWAGWTKMTEKLGNKLQIVGDDLLVTNIEFLKKGIEQHAANAILIKLNQIGTLTETIAAIEMAKENGWNAVVSHRSGETEDTTIAHLAVGLNTQQIKTGSLSRTDRVCKYNELLRIEEALGKKAVYPGKSVFNK